MNPATYVLLALILTLWSAVAVNPKHDSFISLVSSQRKLAAPEEEAPEDFDQAPETGARPAPGKGKAVESIASLFKHPDKTNTKRKNNLLVLELEGFKNVRNKSEVEVSHLQVQKTTNMFTNNTDKGVLHFQTPRSKIADKGSLGRATLKLTKLFDAKSLGFKCNSNAVQLYLIEPVDKELKLKVVKGPVKMEFKKNEVEVDVTKFFEDLEDEGPSLSGSASALQLTYLSPKTSKDDDIEFDEEGSGKSKAEASSSDDSEEGFFDKKSERSGSQDRDESPSSSGDTVDKYLMLEADPNCYFAFDVDKNKPKVKLEMTKTTTTVIRGAYKKSAIGVAAVAVVGLLGGLGFVL